MKRLVLLAAAVLTAGCTTGRDRYAQNDDYSYFDRAYYSQYGGYDYNRPDPRHGGDYADNDYRSDRRYRPRELSNNDRVYRGSDGRYCCRRSDGSTSLIVGAVAGGVLGDIIAPGHSGTLGTVLGALGGAAGAAIDSSIRTRWAMPR